MTRLSNKSPAQALAANATAAVSQLCPACGLCCNGVIFADVRLQKGDDPVRLAALGLPLERRGKIVRFAQPCSALKGNLCCIYAERPVRCRSFECRVLQRAQTGKLTTAAALKLIQRARRQEEVVRGLLLQLGQRDEHLPFMARYAQIMAEPDDLAGDPKVIRLRGRLMLAAHKLMQILERDFLA